MTGKTLGHYQILERLGSGGMGEVFKARDTHLNRVVAIKILRADRLADQGRKQRFIQEAQAASALNHPNIVVIHDITKQGDLDYMVMECVPGKTLDALIPRQGMRLGDALKVAIQMADALAKAHAAGIIHRDLKPSNVMVSEDGHVKVLDFGLAKLTESGSSGEDDNTRTVRPETKEGTILGTPAYMSPEQAEGRKMDVRSDIFSFGSVLYEMATGRRAFTGESPISTLSAVLKEEPKTPEGLPPDLEKIIRRCLRKDPARRFQHMDDLKVALEEVREDSASGILAAAPGQNKRKAVPGWVWVAAAVTLAAGGLGTWRMTRSEPKPAEAWQKIPLTSYPGAEIAPTFSPDGRQVAFSWNGEKRSNFEIYVKLVDGGEPLRLTHDPADALMPQWSPDGRFIAFLRKKAIYLISPLGGTERKVTDAGPYNLAWTPDGKSIAFTDGPPGKAGGVILLNLDSGERRTLTNPPASSGGDVAFSFSPDGKNLAFTRRIGGTGPSELFVAKLPDGAPKRLELANDFLYSLAWTPDGKDVVVAIERGGTTALWRVPVESGSASRIAGLDDGAEFPAVSAASHRLAYARTIQDENIWTLNGTEQKELIASTRRDFNPQFSPDESKIAFVSDRTGGWEIYASDAQGGRVVQLTSFGNTVADGVRWSPDGRDIAFAVVQSGHRNIYVVPAEGGAVRRITAEPADEGRPSFSMDGKWIYFRSNRTGEYQIWKAPRGGGPATQVTRSGGYEPVESLDGKTLYFVHARNEKGLRSMPAAGGAEQAVDGLEQVGQGLWGVTADGICYLAPLAGLSDPRPILCWSSSTGKTSRMGAVEKPVWNAPPAFSVSRDGRRFLWNQTDHRDSDLVLVENFR